MIISRSFLLRMRNVSDKIYTKSKHTLCSITLFFENRNIIDVMWTYTVQPDRPQMTIWGMRIAYWIPKATNTSSEYVILLIFHGKKSCTNETEYYVTHKSSLVISFTNSWNCLQNTWAKIGEECRHTKILISKFCTPKWSTHEPCFLHSQCPSPSLQPYRVNRNHSPQNHDTEQLNSRHRLHSVFRLVSFNYGTFERPEWRPHNAVKAQAEHGLNSSHRDGCALSTHHFRNKISGFSIVW